VPRRSRAGRQSRSWGDYPIKCGDKIATRELTLSKHGPQTAPKRRPGPLVIFENAQVRRCAPGGIRTPDRRIRSPMLTYRIGPPAADLCRFVRASTVSEAGWCRRVPGRSATYEQTTSKHGTDALGGVGSRSATTYGEGQVVNHPMSMPAARVGHRLVRLCTNPPATSGSAPAIVRYRHDGNPTRGSSTRKGAVFGAGPCLGA
jgi:hypothetical protein